MTPDTRCRYMIYRAISSYITLYQIPRYITLYQISRYMRAELPLCMVFPYTSTLLYQISLYIG